MLSKVPQLKIQILTLFPDIFDAHLKHLPISRALEKELVKIDFINLRDFAIDKRGTVDSPPYGGGPGMILRPEPIFNAITYALGNILKPSPDSATETTHIVFLTPKGKTYNQTEALNLSKIKNLIIVCGRYEGMDQRVIDYFTSSVSSLSSIQGQEVSIGNYVLSGGEVAAMVVVESIVRLIPGGIENQDALLNESFNPDQPTQKEHPQYSRPEKWQGLEVPKTLLSGHHKKVADWKKQDHLNP